MSSFARLGMPVRTADTGLIIGGIAQNVQRLNSLPETWALLNRSVFSGRLDRNSVRDLLQRGHVAVSASFVETFGIVLIEALVSVVLSSQLAPAARKHL